MTTQTATKTTTTAVSPATLAKAKEDPKVIASSRDLSGFPEMIVFKKLNEEKKFGVVFKNGTYKGFETAEIKPTNGVKPFTSRRHIFEVDGETLYVQATGYLDNAIKDLAVIPGDQCIVEYDGLSKKGHHQVFLSKLG